MASGEWRHYSHQIMTRTYIWQQSEWPAFRWDAARLLEPLGRAHHARGRLAGALQTLGFSSKREAVVEALTEEVVKSSDIEGETLERREVRSSVARRLGIDELNPARVSARVDGVVRMLLDATQNYADPMTAKRLWSWHVGLFPEGRSGLRVVRFGTWRDDADGAMQVVSGRIGNERIHYEAPPAAQIPREMDAFFAWLDKPSIADGLLRAAIAHFWFVTIHPFDDGNGRIARALADRMLALADESPERFYSMSRQIRADRTAYYDVLESVQSGTLDITQWLTWFLGCFERAVDAATATITAVLQRSEAWKRYAGTPLNARQSAMLNRVLEGLGDALTTKRWAKLTRSSVATAQRDINDLIARGVLKVGSGGSKNTVYELA